ncbi:P pilus assembly protein, pilin FimA [Providencia stuartii]|nr:P pilus assembly protein, pilin FimA [Providencia stuartii]CAK6610587.1 P pilus assembly protein, pilin FimA [Providencia stuartii]SST03276.1 P pilus assembly protein, pilin FimA [Acinetobacter baumannii]SUC41382.1 P pilus assembly protein, pilin FimA [Providencia stuartii]
MTLAERINSMVGFNKSSSIFFVLMLTNIGQLYAVGTAEVDLSASLVDGSCSIELSDKALHFKPYSVASFPTAKTTVEIQPISAKVTCEGGNTTPLLTLKGITPYSGNNQVFLDSTPNGTGFMIQHGKKELGLNDFYNGDALENQGKQVALTPLNSSNQFSSTEYFGIGLVSVDNTVTPDFLKANITFTVLFQ